MSVMVIGNVTIRWTAYDFLLTFYSNYVYLMSFLGYSLLKNIATLKSRSRVNQGNWNFWKRYHSIDCVWFPYSKFVPKTQVLYLQVLYL